jgi:hypothetical protein
VGRRHRAAGVYRCGYNDAHAPHTAAAGRCSVAVVLQVCQVQLDVLQVLQCTRVTIVMLRCYGVTVLRCYGVTVLQCYSVRRR